MVPPRRAVEITAGADRRPIGHFQSIAADLIDLLRHRAAAAAGVVDGHRRSGLKPGEWCLFAALAAVHQQSLV